jgi:hypothetical protein
VMNKIKLAGGNGWWSENICLSCNRSGRKHEMGGLGGSVLGPSFDVQALGQAFRVPAGYQLRVFRERISPVMMNR